MQKYFFFFGHKGPKGCFSQWFIRNFKVDGHEYCCMEQYMMAQKAILFKDFDTLKEILNSTDPKEIKALGRKVKNFDTATWDAHKRDIVYKGNLAKFSQNEDLKEMLLATADLILVEASPYDRVWGIGLRASNPLAQDESTWQGQNLLGYALTKVKETLADSRKKEV